MKLRYNLCFNIFNYTFWLLLSFIMLFPFLLTLATSLSSDHAILSGKVTLLPQEFTINSYLVVYNSSRLFASLWNTVIVTVVGTAINLLFTILAAYPLSKNNLEYRKLYLGLILFTMLFSAGMIPELILVRYLGFYDNYLSIWIPGAISVYNMLVLISFFKAIPASLEESATMDGASRVTSLVNIILPLSKAALATIGLFYAVSHWNSYMNVLIYIKTSSLFTLQITLRQLLFEPDTMQNMLVANNATNQSINSESLKAAAAMIGTVPILIVYPYLQRYFIKGVMIGSVKG